MTTQYEITEESSTAKEIYTICGSKGTGKTSFAFRFTGGKYCISFDRKAQRIKQYSYANNPEIRIYDGVKYYKRTAEDMVPSAMENFNYLVGLLEFIATKEDADWVVIDNLERLHEICEMCMRHDNKKGPFEGFSNQNLWKLRRIYLTRIHALACKAAKKGVIYTVYSKVEDVDVVDGQIINRKEVPKYIDVVEEETDVIFQTKVVYSPSETKFQALVLSSKIPKFVTGKLLNLTKTPQQEIRNAQP